MTELQKYLTDEIAEDLADGIITGGRRCGASGCLA